MTIIECFIPKRWNSWALQPRGGNRSDLFNITSSDPLEEFVLPRSPCNFKFCGSGGPVSQSGDASTRHRVRISINLKVWLSSGHSGLLMSANYQAEKEVAVLSGIVNSVMRR